MKSIVVAAYVVLGSIVGAHASVLTFDLANGLRVTANTTLPSATFAPFPIGGRVNTLFAQTGDGYDAQGTLIAKSPFAGDDTRAYDAVLSGGFARFLSPLPPVGPNDPTFGFGLNSLSFIWGSPDLYNSVTFLGSGLQVTGGDLGALADGGGSYLVTITGQGQFYGTLFKSDQNAFEFAAVSAVPLPASALMFGAALLALSGLGYMAQRKNAAAAA